MYTAVKSLNNNLVLVLDSHQEELILFGKGIGFKKKKGDQISEVEVSKIYQVKGSQPTSILDELSPEILSVTEKIIQLGEERLHQKLSTSILISLADHLQYAIERKQMNTQLAENTLQWEIKYLYYKEFELGECALTIIHQELDITLPEAEASFIALHFVNAQDEKESKNETLLIAAITKDMVKIIQSLFGVALNKESINYSRFVTHIRYFMNRQFHQREEVKNSEGTLYTIIQEQYPKSYACALMIRELLKKDYQFTISDDEMIYLIIHIERVVSEANRSKK